MIKVRFPVVLALLIFTGCHVFSIAQSTDDGWQVLFNGRDMTGWRELNGKHKWEVRDGVIVGTDVHGQPNGFLCTEKEYGDFILELEVSIDTLMNNSGVQFRSRSTADYLNYRVHGYQMEIDPKPQKWSGSIYDEGGRRNWLYTTELNIPGKAAYKNNQWNKYRIECIGHSIRTWVNNIPISHLIDAEIPSGFIGLQLHANNPTDPPGGNQVRFRNIRIKTSNIKPSPLDDIFVVNTIPNDLSPQEKKNNFKLLWDGKTTNGWRDVYKQGFPKNSWEIKNGELTVIGSENKEASNKRDIMTTKTYGPFELKFDFKLTKGANSGVKYFVGDLSKNKQAAAGNSVAALEYQIVDDSIPGIAPNRTLGSLADVLTSQKTRVSFKKTGDWNQGVIKAFSNNMVEYYLNGYKILEFKRGSAEYLDLISNSKYKDLPAFGMSESGHILLEGRGGSVSYRSIKIRKLGKN